MKNFELHFAHTFSLIFYQTIVNLESNYTMNGWLNYHAFQTLEHLGVLIYNPETSSVVETLNFENATNLGKWIMKDLEIFELEPEIKSENDSNPMFATPPTNNGTDQGMPDQL